MARRGSKAAGGVVSPKPVGEDYALDGGLLKALKDGRVEHFCREELERPHVFVTENSRLDGIGASGGGMEGPGARVTCNIGADLAIAHSQSFLHPLEQALRDLHLQGGSENR